MSLSGKTLANTYKDILQMDNSNSGVDAIARSVKDGEGTISALALSDDAVTIQPQNDENASILRVRAKGGEVLLLADGTNNVTKSLGNILNNQYSTKKNGR